MSLVVLGELVGGVVVAGTVVAGAVVAGAVVAGGVEDLVVLPPPPADAAAVIRTIRIAAVAAILPNDGHRVPLHTHRRAMIGEINTHAVTCTQPCCPRNLRQSDSPPPSPGGGVEAIRSASGAPSVP